MFRRKKYSTLHFIAVLSVLGGLVFSISGPGLSGAVHANNLPETAAATAFSDARPAPAERPGQKTAAFEENRGQVNNDARFILRNKNYALYLTRSEAVFALRLPGTKIDESGVELKSDTLRMRFVGAEGHSAPEGLEALPGKTNYYLKDKKNIEGLANFNKVRYPGIYKGIDAVFYQNNDETEYDFVVQPGVAPESIGLAFEGAEKLSVEPNGSLKIKTTSSEINQGKPFAYQDIDGARKEVECRYRLTETEKGPVVGFETGVYDRTRPLVIDPILSYVSYLSGTKSDRADTVDVDAAGNLYLIGSTFSPDFPGTPNEALEYIYITKFSPDGTTVLYNTFFDSFTLSPSDIDVDAGGNAYIAGASLNGFETTPGAFQEVFPDRGRGYNTCIGTIGFVAKLNTAGTIEFSTLLGGNCSDAITGIAVHPNGRIYVAGGSSSSDFPVKNFYQNNPVFVNDSNAFVTVFNAAASGLIYSTMLKGGDKDAGADVGFDSAGNAYVSGKTDSDNFPVKAAFQEEFGGGQDAFIAKINPNAAGEASLIYSTYFGGGGTENSNAIAVTASGKVFITGVTGSQNFPLLKALDNTNVINEAYVSVFNPSGSLNASTFLGGNGQEEGLGISLDTAENIYVTGRTTSTDFLRNNAVQNARSGPQDGFVTKLKFSPTGFTPLLSTYFGGNLSDSCRSTVPRGQVETWTACQTESIDIQVTVNALDPTPGGDGKDGLIFRMIDRNADTIGVFNPALLQFQLKNSITGGPPDIIVNRGAAGDVAVKGDFNGDGIDTVSNFNNGTWTIRNFNVSTGYSTSPVVITFGQAGDIPVTGDWNGDTIDTLGVFRPSVGKFFLTNSLIAAPPIDITINFGVAGDLPVAGDWNADEFDSVGVFRPSVGQFFLTDDNVLKATVDIGVTFGVAEDLPVAGDFNGDGKDSIGVWRPSVTSFFLTNDNLNIAASAVFGGGGDTPVVGDWDGEPTP